MKKRFKRNKFRKIRIAIFLIISIMLLIVFILGILKKDKNNAKPDNNEFTLQDSVIAEYVKKSDNGVKINVSPKLNQDKKVNGLDIKNIQLTCKNGITTLLADISNNTSKDSEMQNINIKLLDENNNEIRTVRGYIPSLKIGETAKLNVSMSSNLIVAYDIEFLEK